MVWSIKEVKLLPWYRSEGICFSIKHYLNSHPLYMMYLRARWTRYMYNLIVANWLGFFYKCRVHFNLSPDFTILNWSFNFCVRHNFWKNSGIGLFTDNCVVISWAWEVALEKMIWSFNCVTSIFSIWSFLNSQLMITFCKRILYAFYKPG